MGILLTVYGVFSGDFVDGVCVVDGEFVANVAEVECSFKTSIFVNDKLEGSTQIFPKCKGAWALPIAFLITFFRECSAIFLNPVSMNKRKPTVLLSFLQYTFKKVR